MEFMFEIKKAELKKGVGVERQKNDNEAKSKKEKT
jgi:hypothetical protein